MLFQIPTSNRSFLEKDLSEENAVKGIDPEGSTEESTGVLRLPPVALDLNHNSVQKLHQSKVMKLEVEEVDSEEEEEDSEVEEEEEEDDLNQHSKIKTKEYNQTLHGQICDKKAILSPRVDHLSNTVIFTYSKCRYYGTQKSLIVLTIESHLYTDSQSA